MNGHDAVLVKNIIWYPWYTWNYGKRS